MKWMDMAMEPGASHIAAADAQNKASDKAAGEASSLSAAASAVCKLEK